MHGFALAVKVYYYHNGPISFQSFSFLLMHVYFFQVMLKCCSFLAQKFLALTMLGLHCTGVHCKSNRCIRSCKVLTSCSYICTPSGLLPKSCKWHSISCNSCALLVHFHQLAGCVGTAHKWHGWASSCCTINFQNAPGPSFQAAGQILLEGDNPSALRHSIW